MRTTPTTPEVERAAPPRSSLGYVAALDGLRAAALLGMLLYHQGTTWFPGGVLTVSTFFTLSGFLITRLLLDEVGASGGVRLGRFYVQRFRRLLPAAVVSLFAITVVWRVTSRPLADGDVLSALFYAANWWSLHIDRSYAELFGAASPVQHFWSLSIEEQFYFVFPLVLVGTVKLVRHPSRTLMPLALLMTAGFVWGAVLAGGGADPSRAYYGTGARAAEFLAGAVLAAAMTRPATRRALRGLADGLPGRAAATAALAVLVVGWAEITFRADGLFPWGVATNAALTCIVIVAALGPGPVGRLLGFAPLAALGRLSYGVYLLHWPVFLLLSPHATHRHGAPLFVLRFAVSVGLAVLLHRLVEDPVRRRRMLPGAAFWYAAVGGSALVVACVLWWPTPAPPADAFDTSAMAEARQRALRVDDTVAPVLAARPAAAPTTVAPLPVLPTTPGLDRFWSAAVASAPPEVYVGEPRPRRLLIIGDSMAWTVAGGLRPWGTQHGMEVEVFHAVGCGLAGDTPIKYLGTERDASGDCQKWWADLPTVIANYDPGVVLVVGGMADLSERELPDGSWSHIGDPVYDAWLEARQRTLVDVLTAGGAVVGWATLPHLHAPYQPGLTGRPPFDENDPARADRLNQLVRQLDDADPRVTVVDFAGYGQLQPGGEFAHDYRPDGVHLGARSSKRAAPWFGSVVEGLLVS
jgi:peptidoglycan/LPS O-acetylase OafA/YrhL